MTAPAVFDGLGPLFKDDSVDNEIFINIHIKRNLKKSDLIISQSVISILPATIHACYSGKKQALGAYQLYYIYQHLWVVQEHE